MGTNFYLKLKQPRMVPHYDEIHIAKRSCGWKPLFQAVDPYPYHREWIGPEVRQPDDPGVTEYSIHSVADIRTYLATGEYEVVDEYGDTYTTEEFEEEVIRWNANNDDAWAHVDHPGACSYVDPEGFEFQRAAFS